jgi:hypothetical protein
MVLMITDLTSHSTEYLALVNLVTSIACITKELNRSQGRRSLFSRTRPEARLARAVELLPTTTGALTISPTLVQVVQATARVQAIAAAIAEAVVAAAAAVKVSVV